MLEDGAGDGGVEHGAGRMLLRTCMHGGGDEVDGRLEQPAAYARRACRPGAGQNMQQASVQDADMVAWDTCHGDAG
jgi:hypothetical protein